MVVPPFIPLITRSRYSVRCVGRSVVEGDILPEFECRTQRAAPLRRLLKDLRPFIEVITPFIACLNHSFHGNAVGCRTSGDALWMTDRTTTKLKHYVFTQVVQELVHLPGMNSTRCDRHDGWHGHPILLEEQSQGRISVVFHA